MAINLRPLPPPLGQKLLDENGYVSKPWADFFNAAFRYEQAIAAAVADGTYTLGTGTTDGEITITTGIITAVQEVVA